MEREKTLRLKSKTKTLSLVHIPYFGVIKITRLELSKDSPRSRNNSPRGTCVAQPQMIDNSSTIITEPLGTKPKMLQPKLGMSYGIQDTDAITPIDRNCNHIETQSITNSLGETQTIHSTGMNTGVLQSEPQPQFDIPSDPYWECGDYPELAARGEDRAFQGVDMTFFDNLMRSTPDANKNSDWFTRDHDA